MTATFPLILALVSGLPQSDTPPQSDTIPPDSYEDRHVRELVARAREARRTMRAGLESYEGVLRERTYMGLSGSRFRRERALFQEDRVGRIRWEVTGDNAVHWRGARWKVPIFGETEAQEEFTESMSSSLARGVTPMPLSFDPGDDRLVFGSGDALNPLADSAALHYRYYSGDTLRVRLPTGDREIVMAEVRVEPRRSSFDLLSGSLWFDVETAVLVRAAYRPARPFDFDLDAPEDAGYVPGFFKPITVEIKYVTVEYALQEFQWWLPRRYALRGEAKVASLFRTPVTVEWSVSRYEVNESEGLLAEALSGRLPPGWSRTDREVASRPGQPPRYITVLIPPIDSLINSPELPPEDLGPEPVAFSDQELDKLRAELEALLPRPPGVPRLAYGLLGGLDALQSDRGAERRCPWISLSSAADLPHRDREGRNGRPRPGRRTLSWARPGGAKRGCRRLSTTARNLGLGESLLLELFLGQPPLRKGSPPVLPDSRSRGCGRVAGPPNPSPHPALL